VADEREVASALEATRKMLAELKDEIGSYTVQRDKLGYDIISKRKELNTMESARLEINNKIAEYRDKMKTIEHDILEKERDLAKQAEQKRIREEYERQNAIFNEQLKAFEWGDKALPHQIEGAKALAIAKRGVLGDKRGLGKTLTSIAWLDLIGAKKVLAIVPNDVMGNFEREVLRWAPHRSVVIIGGYNKIQRNALLDVFKLQEDIFLIINYEAWRRDSTLLQRLIDVRFDTVIADEAHIIKEMKTNAYQGIERLLTQKNECPKCQSTNHGTAQDKDYGLPIYKCFKCDYIQTEHNEFNSVKNFVPMTGTPILNKPQDIFPLLHLVNPVLFDDKDDFLYDYCERDIWSNKWKFKPGGIDRLANKLRGFYVARDRFSAGVIIPQQTVQIHDIPFDKELYPKQWEGYQLLRQKSAMVMDDLLKHGNKGVSPVMAAIALITRQRQMMTWPKGIMMKDPETKQILFESEVDESIKLDYIIHPKGTGLLPLYVKDEQERVVVFSQFVQPLIELERRIKNAGISVARYDGSTTPAQAQAIQMDFDRAYQKPDEPPKWDVLLAHYKKGGVGLNLNAATQTIILDEEWNPGKEDQAFGRTDRMGQTEETTVHILRVAKTIDSWMAGLIKMKGEMIAGFETRMDLEQELIKILTMDE